MSDKLSQNARFCWTRKHLSRPENTYVLFRREVNLPVKPREAIVRVSGDARYTLYVNGKRIHQGPARFFADRISFDTIDLADELDAGRNSICAIVHQFGCPTFFYQYRDVSSFMLEGEIIGSGDPVPLHTPEGWLCREAKGWRKHVARLSVQLGWQEHYDADADPAGWMSRDYVATEADGWKSPGWSIPAGAPPYLHPEPRNAPLLRSREHSFAEIAGQFHGENARGYKIAEDVYHLPLEETRKKDGSIILDPQNLLRDDVSLTTIQPPADGEFACLVLDAGQYRTGHLQLDIAEAAGDEIIDILYAEALEPKTGFVQIIGDGTPAGCEEATADRYRCRAGAQTWEPFHLKGMKYVALIFRNVEKPLKIRHVGIRQVFADVPDAGSFECSDKRLNEIWRVGRETQRNCLFDAFVDCPWREQAMWWGDARVQARVTSYAFGDVSLFARGIRLMAQSQGPDGALHSHPPADIPEHRLPDFSLTWVSSLWDYYFQTGQTELLKECLPVLHRLMEFFARHENERHLIGSFDGWWVFLDWQTLYKKNHSSVLNLLYLQALRHAAAVSELCGDRKNAAVYAGKAVLLGQAIEEFFWDKDSKNWRDGFDAQKREPVNQVSQHANSLAILMGLKPEARARIVRDLLLKSARARKPSVLTGSPFFYAYILEAMIESGFRVEAIDLIRDKWGEMIEAGATTFWELWQTTSTSRCHAWSASPVYHLSQQVLGVVPTRPGWTEIRISPTVGKLEFARGTVPTPLGALSVEWEKVAEDQLAVCVDVPEGMAAEFVTPGGDIRHLRSGRNEFQT